MAVKLITVITTTKNCIEFLPQYIASFATFDTSLFDWIVVDAGSTDGTREYLERFRQYFAWFTSETDDGFYFGLNKAIANVTTKYYVVFGADDRPSPSFLQNVLPLLNDSHAMVLGATRLLPSGSTKYPGYRWMHHWTWGRVISHHSVGTIIRTDLHATYGAYDSHYRVVADGAFIKRVLQSNEKVRFTRIVFGDYHEGGFSGQQGISSIWESFLVQADAGSNLLLQLALLSLRIIKVRKSFHVKGERR